MLYLFLLSTAAVWAYIQTAIKIVNLRSVTVQWHVWISYILVFAMSFASYEAVVLFVTPNICATLTARIFYWMALHGVFGAVYVWISWDLFRRLRRTEKAIVDSNAVVRLSKKDKSMASAATRSQRLGVETGLPCMLIAFVVSVVVFTGLMPDDRLPVSGWRMLTHLGIFLGLVTIWTLLVFKFIIPQAKREN